MRLVINNIQIILKADAKIVQTKQVNDIASLDNRQTNFTNSFDVPKIAHNIKSFKFLNLIGNLSNVPYQKNEAYLYAENGECFIYKGWAVVSDSNEKSYKVHIYDGNIDLFKAIEKKYLSDLDLTLINHGKSLTAIQQSWLNNLNYKYIVADFNGNLGTVPNSMNIEYLLPSAKIQFLWNQLFLKFNATFSGTIFENSLFQNLWITYPKVVTPVIAFVEVFKTDYCDVPLTGGGTFYSGTVPFVNPQILSADISLVGGQYVFNVTKEYRIELNIYTPAYWVASSADQDGNFVATNVPVDIVDQFIYFVSSPGMVLANPSFYFSGLDTIYDATAYSAGLSVKEFNSGAIDFNDGLKGFSCKDLINEILWRFGLTIFKRKYQNHYVFKTIFEITDRSKAIDWSKKFLSKTSEKYIYGGYAQKNIFKYKYNDDKLNYNDGFLNVDNKNLPEERTAIQSKIFSPEKDKRNEIGFLSNVYKMWDREIKETAGVSSVIYKPLQNRYYLMRFENKTISGTTVPVESFVDMPFENVINGFYSEMKALLNKSLILNCNFWLNDSDIIDIDLSVPYYIKQLGGYFIINKILNFESGKITKVELIKINYNG